MKLTIITPHYENFNGLKHIYQSLMTQTKEEWEWIIIDDFSSEAVRVQIINFFDELKNSRIHLVLNTVKTNASVCRNQGVEIATYDRLVFLDSDDSLSPNFVANRLIKVKEFVIFSKYFIKSEDGTCVTSKFYGSNHLDRFLSAQFIWQTTAVLWNKKFLINLGKFDPEFDRLQDVELSIRSLIYGKDYAVLNNEPDFYYHVKPIRTKINFLPIVSNSTSKLILKLYSSYKLTNGQRKLLLGYYYLCVKYLHRSQLKTDVKFVKQNLNIFYAKRNVSLLKYIIGLVLLDLYKFNLISNDLFLRTNRYFFKPKFINGN